MTLALEPADSPAVKHRKAAEMEKKVDALYLNDYDPLDLALDFRDEVEILLSDPQIIARINALKNPDLLTTVTIRALQSEAITDAERALKCFTRRNLQKLPNWDEWLQAEH